MTLGAMPHTTRIRVPMTAEDPHAPPHESIRGWSSSVKPSVRHSNSTVGAFMNDLSFSKRRSHHGSSQPAPASAFVRGRHHDFVVPAGLPALAELRRSLPIVNISHRHRDPSAILKIRGCFIRNSVAAQDIDQLPHERPIPVGVGQEDFVRHVRSGAARVQAWLRMASAIGCTSGSPLPWSSRSTQGILRTIHGISLAETRSGPPTRTGIRRLL